MNALTLGPVRRARGSVRLPGSKSISNRILLLAALAKGRTVVRGLLDAEDTRVMLQALKKLRVAVNARKFAEITVLGEGRIPSRRKDLFLGNAGTAFRPLAAVLALSGGEYRLMGAPRMHERPIGDLVDALRGIGASIDYLGKPGYPPLAIHPGNIHAASSVQVRGDVSSQYLSALLLALPLAGGGSVEVQGELISQPYVAITLRLMRRFGVGTRRKGWRSFLIPPSPYVSPGEIVVEGDASSATYFLAAGAIAGGPVRVEGVGRGSMQGDLRFTEVLEAMGARVTLGADWIEAASPGKLRPIDMDLNHIPDAAMTAAVMALYADGPSTIRNIASWRVKETDRIAAMANELRKLGAAVETGADFIRIAPPARLADGAAIDTYDDHRMAMCFSLAALGGVAVTINDPECVAKTFPDYFSAFAGICDAT